MHTDANGAVRGAVRPLVAAICAHLCSSVANSRCRSAYHPAPITCPFYPFSVPRLSPNAPFVQRRCPRRLEIPGQFGQIGHSRPRARHGGRRRHLPMQNWRKVPSRTSCEPAGRLAQSVGGVSEAFSKRGRPPAGPRADLQGVLPMPVPRSRRRDARLNPAMPAGPLPGRQRPFRPGRGRT